VTAPTGGEPEAMLHEKLRGSELWHLATSGPGGRPHVSAVWLDLRDGRILFNTAIGRVKQRNLEANPLVAISWVDVANPEVNLSVQGRVVETISGEPAEADCDEISQKYIGGPYPWRAPGERRISYLIEPTRIHRPGG
jgi:PPOX class probable F420-dependent enzyme